MLNSLLTLTLLKMNNSLEKIGVTNYQKMLVLNYRKGNFKRIDRIINTLKNRIEQAKAVGINTVEWQ
jgi:hypothetical protein